jgi:glycosyltransferase involved in cell wall biosynthesis
LPFTKEPIVFASARFDDDAKNVATLAAAAPEIKWPVVAAGPGAVPPTLRALGHVDDGELGAWMSRASIFVHPSRYEPFGLSALAAARRRCALVVSDVASQHELWGESAVYVAPDDHHALAAAVNDLIDDEPRREAMAERARVRAACFTKDRMVAAYLGVYSDVASGPPTERTPPPCA